MTMSIYQITFIVVALACSVSSKGYRSDTHDASRSIGGVRGGDGGYITRTTIDGLGGRASLGGMGSHPGGVGVSTTDGGIGRRAHSVESGLVGGYRGNAPYVGGFEGRVMPGKTGQAGAFDGPAGSYMLPQPYSIGYEATDEQGNIQSKTEFGDGKGNVQGQYEYRNSQGLYRQVQYTAGQFGFRANIKTNEPGVGKESPADVNMIVEQTPAGIQEQYAAPHQTGISGRDGVKSPYGGGSVIGGGGRAASGVYQGGYQGVIGGGMSGRPTSGDTGAIGGTRGLFSGVKRSSSGKSVY